MVFKKSKSFKLKKLAVVVAAMTILFTLTACKDNTNHLDRIERITGIKLPQGIEIEYSYIDQVFTGRASQYTVLKLAEEPTEFLSSDYRYGGELYYTERDGTKVYKPVVSGTLCFKKGRSSYFEKEFDHSISMHAKIQKGKIIKITPEEYYPDWESPYLMQVSKSSAYMAYFPDKLQLIIYIIGH